MLFWNCLKIYNIVYKKIISCNYFFDDTSSKKIGNCDKPTVGYPYWSFIVDIYS